MDVAFYAPFKPLGHPHPSGDLIIASGIRDFLQSRGHQISQASTLRARWIYWRPQLWAQIYSERCRLREQLTRHRPDLWMTYHTYYKAPDLLGPKLCQMLHLPYVIFQGIFSTKRRRRLKTWPGFYLNRSALLAADHIFTNRRLDHINLKRLVHEERLTYIKPGIFPADFQPDPDGGAAYRKAWGIGNEQVLLSAAMFRPDVKTQGLQWLIETLSMLSLPDIPFKLIIAGDGSEKARLQRLANEQLPGKVRFIGKLDRGNMAKFYSAGDLFVFPGIRESLGMVYLEAQSCGVPVVAFDNGGIPEVVANGATGLLTKPFDAQAFRLAVQELLNSKEKRTNMAAAAGQYVRRQHDLSRNYLQLESILKTIHRRDP